MLWVYIFSHCSLLPLMLYEDPFSSWSSHIWMLTSDVLHDPISYFRWGHFMDTWSIPSITLMTHSNYLLRGESQRMEVRAELQVHASQPSMIMLSNGFRALELPWYNSILWWHVGDGTLSMCWNNSSIQMAMKTNNWGNGNMFNKNKDKVFKNTHEFWK